MHEWIGFGAATIIFALCFLAWYLLKESKYDDGGKRAESRSAPTGIDAEAMTPDAPEDGARADSRGSNGPTGIVGSGVSWTPSGPRGSNPPKPKSDNGFRARIDRAMQRKGRK